MNHLSRHDPLARLIIVEPDFAQLRPVLDALREEDFKVAIRSTVETALDHVGRLDFGVAILSLQPTRADDAAQITQFARLNSRVHLMLRIAEVNQTAAQAAIRLGAFAVVDRDEPLTTLVDEVHRAFRDHYQRIAWREIEPAVAPPDVVASDKWRRELHRRTG